MTERIAGARAHGNVAVVGSANIDISVRVERLPGPGETLLGHDVRRGGGGKGANQAVAAARAGGADTTMIGCVGEDTDGRAVRQALEADGINCTALGTAPDVSTGLALITVDDNAENCIVVATGANDRVTVDETARSLIARADVVLAQLEVPQTVLVDAALARRPESLFVLNAAPWAPLLPELVAQVDLLVVNEHEARGLSGADDLAAAQEVLLENVPAVVVTLGPAGSRLCRRGRDAVEVTAPSAEALDTTGAGDTFCGVLGAELAAGSDDLTALRRASAAASLAVERPGAQDAVPTRERVDMRHVDAYGVGPRG